MFTHVFSYSAPLLKSKMSTMSHFLPEHVDWIGEKCCTGQLDQSCCTLRWMHILLSCALLIRLQSRFKPKSQERDSDGEGRDGEQFLNFTESCASPTGPEDNFVISVVSLYRLEIYMLLTGCWQDPDKHLVHQFFHYKCFRSKGVDHINFFLLVMLSSVSCVCLWDTVKAY